MKTLAKHPPCGVYSEEATICRTCDEFDAPLMKFVWWAQDAMWLMCDYWVHYDRKVADYIESHTRKAIEQ